MSTQFTLTPIPDKRMNKNRDLVCVCVCAHVCVLLLEGYNV